VRDVADVIAEAGENGLSFVERVPMPANNFVLVFARDSSSPDAEGTLRP
jgi:hypothetical protein